MFWSIVEEVCFWADVFALSTAASILLALGIGRMIELRESESVR